ncbi:hypothetical protein SAMN04490189_3979 [Pseudomonas koreensis]|jgi:hypothetical protein|uniref:hypothetical protein n=1 Tax=Pseudomonas TaxID=286 RepID=UPI00087A6022|nr:MULTISPECIES: hypothetical protein [Pseudomonas]PNB79122.1 hypothetical protein C1X30_19895 [Pseudomonas sp. FW305-BF6]KAB0515177.1 hypothetical protein F7R05_05830 [Pseudomonas koreensis]NNA60849.1 hypothetical protein [Pseudomonas koreensis]PNA02271.1 hypothetical protein C1X28_24145 [Pseudomonas sp. FW305-BF15]SDD99885.1 hypothetical protein SAMN04490189_3979 [Pseudomonas koreensis]
MATKTSKRAGETSTTVSVGIRIDPKIKFALDIMGRVQKRSLTAVIEWAIAQAMSQAHGDFDGNSLSSVIDKVWSTDESVRLVNLALYMPEALTYDELRIWETIKASAYFWQHYPDMTFSTEPDRLVMFLVTDNWDKLLDHVSLHKSSPTIVPITDKELIPF